MVPLKLSPTLIPIRKPAVIVPLGALVYGSQTNNSPTSLISVAVFIRLYCVVDGLRIDARIAELGVTVFVKFAV